MDGISAIIYASRDLLATIFSAVPGLVWSVICAIIPPMIAIMCYSTVAKILFDIKLVYRTFNLLGAELKNNYYDGCYPWLVPLAILAQSIWLGCTSEQPDLTYRWEDEADPSTPQMSWSVKVHTTTIVCIIVSQSVAVVMGVIAATVVVLCEWLEECSEDGERLPILADSGVAAAK